MKTIIYAISVLLISITLMATTNLSITEKNVIKLAAISKYVDNNLLDKSANILTQRLDILELSDFSITTDQDKKQIIVKLSGSFDQEYIERVLTSKGEFNFYEALTYDESANLIGKDNMLFEMIIKDNIWRPWIGSADPKNATQITDYLHSLEQEQVKLIGQLEFDDECFCVYALNLDNEGNPLLGKQHIERMDLKKRASSNSYLIEIQFKQNAIDIWKNATQKNIGKTIVMLLDNKVVSAPKVSAVISSGLCEITGNFDKKESDYLLSLIKTETLPIVLEVIDK
jgi:preprotein translocase subunit SecD